MWLLCPAHEVKNEVDMTQLYMYTLPNIAAEMVVVKGSCSGHSVRLVDLERETRPLWRLRSCSYKKTSEEREFRTAGFLVDWCSFRSHQINLERHEHINNDLKNDVFYLFGQKQGQPLFLYVFP